MESYLIQHRQLILTLSELIYHVMSLDYRKLYVEVWVTLLLAQVTFVHANAPSLIHQKQYVTVNHNSKSNSFHRKSTSFEQIRFIQMAWPYVIDFL